MGAERRTMKPDLSIVVPALNEAAGILATLAALQPLRARGVELVLADGGSSDTTAAQARPWVDTVVDAPRGRALQMNAGAARARADVLLFLHADTRLPPLLSGNGTHSQDNAIAAPIRPWRPQDSFVTVAATT